MSSTDAILLSSRSCETSAGVGARKPDSACRLTASARWLLTEFQRSENLKSDNIRSNTGIEFEGSSLPMVKTTSVRYLYAVSPGGSPLPQLLGKGTFGHTETNASRTR